MPFRTIADEDVVTEENAMRRACRGVNISQVSRDPATGLINGVLVRPARNLLRQPMADNIHIVADAGIYHLVMPHNLPDDHVCGYIEFAYGRHSRLRA